MEHGRFFSEEDPKWKSKDIDATIGMENILSTRRNGWGNWIAMLQLKLLGFEMQRGFGEMSSISSLVNAPICHQL